MRLFQVVSQPPPVAEGELTPAVEVVHLRGLKQHRIPVHQSRLDDTGGILVGEHAAIVHRLPGAPAQTLQRRHGQEASQPPGRDADCLRHPRRESGGKDFPLRRGNPDPRTVPLPAGHPPTPPRAAAPPPPHPARRDPARPPPPPPHPPPPPTPPPPPRR